MSKQFHTAITTILKMPYYKNEAARSGLVLHGHEEAVAQKLKEASFTEELKETYPELTKTLLKKWGTSGDDSILEHAIKDMPAGSYIKQPAGSQGFPDILVKDFNNRLIAIECKSTQKESVMWNDSLPKAITNAIYVLNSGTHNNTTAFIGSDIIDTTTVQLLEAQYEKLKQIDEEYFKLIKSSKSNWRLRTRPQYNTFGKKINFFKHVKRIERENAVLAYSLQ